MKTPKHTFPSVPAMPVIYRKHRAFRRSNQLFRVICAVADHGGDEAVAYRIAHNCARYFNMTDKELMLCVYNAGKRRAALLKAAKEGPLQRLSVSVENEADLKYALKKYLTVDTRPLIGYHETADGVRTPVYADGERYLDCINGIELDIIFIDEAHMPKVQK